MAAYEIPGFTFTAKAGADLSAKQFYFVKLSAPSTVIVCSAATDVACGILQNKPASGAEAKVMAIGISKISSNAALSVGNLIGTSADGQGDAKTPGTDTTEYVLGQVIEPSGAADGIASALINCLAPVRAA